MLALDTEEVIVGADVGEGEAGSVNGKMAPPAGVEVVIGDDLSCVDEIDDENVETVVDPGVDGDTDVEADVDMVAVLEGSVGVDKCIDADGDAAVDEDAGVDVDAGAPMDVDVDAVNADLAMSLVVTVERDVAMVAEGAEEEVWGEVEEETWAAEVETLEGDVGWTSP